MIRRANSFALLALTILLCSCSKSRKAIADNACPVITHLPLSDQAGAIKVLMDQGMSSEAAGAAIDTYYQIVRDGRMEELRGITPGVCRDAITENKAKLAVWRADAANEQKMLASDVQHKLQMEGFKANEQASKALICSQSPELLYCRQP